MPPGLAAGARSGAQQIAEMTVKIKQYDRQIQQLGSDRVSGDTGHAEGSWRRPPHRLTFVLTLGSKERFGRSRDVGCYLGLRPKRSQSGEHDPQLGITQAGNAYLRSLLIECSNHILRPHGRDSALRQWGLHLAARGGKQAKNKSVVAVARKLAVLLHHLWTHSTVHAVLQQLPERSTCSPVATTPRSDDCVRVLVLPRPTDKWQHRLSSRTPTGTELASRQLIRVRIETRWRATKPRTTTKAKAL
jgi:hypothetical protein